MAMNNSIKSSIIVLAIISSSGLSAASFIPPSTDAYYNYAGIRAGGVFPVNIQGNTDLQNSSGDNSYTAGIFVGRKIKDIFAIELEYMNRGESDINSSYSVKAVNDSWAVKADTFMLNMMVDVMTDTKARPYFKVGAGAFYDPIGTLGTVVNCVTGEVIASGSTVLAQMLAAQQKCAKWAEECAHGSLDYMDQADGLCVPIGPCSDDNKVIGQLKCLYILDH